MTAAMKWTLPYYVVALMFSGATTIHTASARPQSGKILSILSDQSNNWCIDADNTHGSKPNTKVHMWKCHTAPNQQMIFERVQSGAYRIRPKGNMRCLGIVNGSMDDGAAVKQQVCKDYSHQLWDVTFQGGSSIDPIVDQDSIKQNSLELRAVHSGLCMAVAKTQAKNGIKIVQLPCQQRANQLWKVESEIEATVSTPSHVPNTASKWMGPFNLPLVAGSAANLPDGRILAWSSFTKMAFQYGLKPEDVVGETVTAIFDPQDGTSTSVTVENTNHDMFCPGTSVLPDGRIMITGGSSSSATTLYDPSTDVWSVGPQMKIPRGYHGQTVLSDGSVFTLGGSWSGGLGNKDGEVWNVATNEWTVKRGIKSEGSLLTHDKEGMFRSDNHMWLFTAPNGKVFHAGPSKKMHWIDTNGDGSVTDSIERSTVDRINGNALMYDIGKILVVGGAKDYGGAVGTKEAYVIDINDEAQVTVEPTGHMHYKRVFSNSVILPSGEVVAVGGQTTASLFTDTLAVYTAEMWSPITGKWRVLANMKTPRTYHSVAILMKDGRVWAAGGGLCGNCKSNKFDAEIFVPPYLIDEGTGNYKTRPVISQAPQVAYPGSVIHVSMDTEGQHTFALNRLSAVTHAVDNDTRRVPLTVVLQNGKDFTLKIPDNESVALPGTYYLFALNSEGVPSVAFTLSIRSGRPVGTGPMISSYSNKCLAMDSSHNIHQWSCGAAPHQNFSFERVGDDYRIVMEDSGFKYCVSVKNGNTHQGANVVGELCGDHNATHQLWSITGSGNSRMLKAEHSGMCLSLSGNSHDKHRNGANVIQFDCTAKSGRHWRVSAVDA